MYFRDIIGQEEVKDRLRQMADSGTVPHALLFAGPEGTGKLQAAIAFARYLLCGGKEGNGNEGGEACGHCPSCVKMDKLVHPDLHFIFPVINKGKSDSPTLSSDEIAAWRRIILEKGYFSYQEWLEELNGENKQAQIFTKESETIQSLISLKSVEGGFKIMIIWHPEKMHLNCANALLKLLEEPPVRTVFMLVTDAPENVLETIQSRTQRIDFRPVPQQLIEEKLQGQGYGLQPDQARRIAHLSGGSWLKAAEALRIDSESEEFLDYFMQLMRFAYARKVRDLKTWSDSMAAKGREWQKRFLTYCQRMVRENFVCNFHIPELNFLTEREQTFSTKFAPFVNENNIIGLMEELQSAQRDIEQNVNSKMVFFDFSLKAILLLKQ
ncbi:MAG: DNA polymerase III subunit delta' [Bacteroidaceae bacterium]|nr:DNA polymerase III subunit delta' [Bacteroidaceae bacterium]